MAIVKCPKCKGNMVQIAGEAVGVLSSSMDNVWVCEKCGEKKTETYFDTKMKERYGK